MRNLNETMSNSAEFTVMLRSEAFPVARYHELTRHQRIGLRQLLHRLKAAFNDLGNRSELPTKPAWLSNERFAQLAFVDGQRGTGKTTLMATLVRLIVSDPNSDFFQNFDRTDGEGVHENDNEQHTDAKKLLDLAQPLQDRIIVLEPLDMESLPKNTPLLAAILARLSSAAREFEPGRNEHRGLLDPDMDDDHDFIRFQQFQAKIARGLDSNLDDRSGSLDREQYGQAVMEQEQDRLQIRQTLDDVLYQLSKAIGGKQDSTQRYLFLVPVDDVDLNPKRCLELLRLLRIYSPPQLYFLLMGQFDLVKNIVNMSMANEYEQVRPLKRNRKAKSDKLIERKILEVAAANLQKMVPDVIELPPLSIQEIMEFRPKGMTKEKSREKKSESLGDLFAKIEFVKTTALPVKIENLYDLLMYHRDSVDSSNRSTSDFQIGTYPGLGAFQVSLRKLVDLYRNLYEALAEKKRNPRTNQFEEDLILQAFDRYWEKIVSEDPLLDSESRERLQREGINACEVIPSSEEMLCNHYSIEGTLVNISESSQDEEVTYQPILSIADMNLNDGLPRLQISRSNSDQTDGAIVTQEILDTRTRCAYVLLHDLRVARTVPEQEELFEGINISSPVTMLWRSESGKTVSIPWPLPRLPSFAKMTALFHKIRKDLDDLKPNLTLSNRSWHGSHMRSEFADDFKEIKQNQLEELVRAWVINGQNAILSESQGKIESRFQWGKIVTWLEENAVRNSVLQNDWFMQIVMLTLPETCVIDLIMKPNHLEQIPEQEQASVKSLLEFSKRQVQELKGRRSQQFDLLWTDEFRDLWIHLNNKFNDDSWINLKLRQPTLRTRNEFRIALDEFGEDFSEHLENKISSDMTKKISDELTNEFKETETRLAFEIELNSIRGLIQQGESLRSSNVQSACSLLRHVLNQAERLYSQNPQDLRVSMTLIDAAEQLGIAYFELLSPRKSFERYMRADEVISNLIEEGHDSQELKQRRIELIISRCYPLSLPIKEFHYQEDIENAIAECRQQLSSHPYDARWIRLCADAQTVQGLTLRDSGLYDDAMNALESAIELFDSIDKEDGEAGEFSLEWARYYLASVHKRKGELESAKAIAESERADARIRSSQHIENSEVQQLYLVTTRLLGQILLYQGDISAAVDLFREAKAIADRDHLRNSTSLLRSRDLARSQIELAQGLRLVRLQNKTSAPVVEALNLLQLALPELERIDLIDHHVALDLGTGYLELARIFWIKNERENARENLDKANSALDRAIEVEYNKAPVSLKMSELHWEFYKNTKNTKQKHFHRKTVEECLVSARENNSYFYPEIQEIERELRKGRRKSPPTKKTRKSHPAKKKR